MSWDSRFAEPIELPGGVTLASLREADRVDFDGLVRSLQDYWSSISAKFPGVDGHHGNRDRPHQALLLIVCIVFVRRKRLVEL